MTHSKSTPKYDLPIFVNNDQPTWLGDFNGAMNKIDAGIATVGANASMALSAANNAVNRVEKVETTMGDTQATANGAYALAQKNEGRINTLDGEVAELNQLKSKFPIHAADIATAAVTAEKLDATAIAAMWKSQRVYRFDSADATADNTGMVGPSNYKCSGFYLADLELLIITAGHLEMGTPTGATITLPSYVPVVVRDIRIQLGCLEWNGENYFYSWNAVKIKGGTRNLAFEGRNTPNAAHADIIGTLVFFVGGGTSDNTSAVAYANANGTFAL
jgi:hypothetical protein|nr:MAG TPA: hypothetical protein [Caudoviricetes sp.]